MYLVELVTEKTKSTEKYIVHVKWREINWQDIGPLAVTDAGEDGWYF